MDTRTDQGLSPIQAIPVGNVAPARLRRVRHIETWILLATFLGTVGCATIAFWPKPPPPSRLALQKLRAIGTAETRAAQRFQQIWSDLEEGGSPQVAADRIDREVLPIWRRGRARLENARRGPLAPHIPPRLTVVFKQREIAWIALSNALRHNNPDEALRFRKAWKAANQLADKIRATSTNR